MPGSAPPIEAVLAEMLTLPTFAAWVGRCQLHRTWSSRLWAWSYLQLAMIDARMPIPVVNFIYDYRDGWKLLVGEEEFDVPYWLYCFLHTHGYPDRAGVMARLEKIQTNLREAGM